MEGKRKASDRCSEGDGSASGPQGGEDLSAEPHGEDSIDEAKIERLLRKAETILSQRTDRILLVLERPLITENYLG